MAAVFLTTPVDVSLGSTGAWTDIDISGQTGYTSSVVGVLIEVINTGTASRAVGLRKNGSTDNRITAITGDTNGKHYVAAIGVDGSGILEGYIANVDTDFWLVGYLFSGDAVFFTNAVDKSTGTTSSWVDMDISGDTGGNTAIGAYIEMSSAGTRNTSLRKNGSTDDRRNVATGQHDWMYCGVDGSEILEQWISVNDADNYLVGYQITGATFHTNATDRSTATTGAYEDVAALPSGAVGGIYEIYNTSGAAGRYNLRTNGGSDDRYYNVNRHSWHIVGVDGSQLCEQKIANTGIDLFELGYYSGGSVNYTLATDPATVSITAQAVTPKATRLLALTHAGLTITGQAVTLNKGATLALSPASVSVSAQDLTVRAARLLGLDPATVTLTGQVVTLTYSEEGGYSLTLDPASTAITGQALGLRAARRLSLDASGFTLTGQVVGTLVGRRLVLAADSLTVNGQALTTTAARLLALSGASTGLTGTDVGLTYSGAVVVVIVPPAGRTWRAQPRDTAWQATRDTTWRAPHRRTAFH